MGKQWKQCQTLFWGVSKSLQMVIAVMKLKDAYSLEEKLWPTWFCSVQFSHSVMSDSLRAHEPQHTRTSCPSPTPGVYPNPCLSSQWYHPSVSSSAVPFSFCPPSFSASGLFKWVSSSHKMAKLLGVSASASFPPKKSQGRSPSEWTGWISLQSKLY